MIAQAPLKNTRAERLDIVILEKTAGLEAARGLKQAINVCLGKYTHAKIYV
jgi:hypothetical protein